jgi:hypothetical protein
MSVVISLSSISKLPSSALNWGLIGEENDTMTLHVKVTDGWILFRDVEGDAIYDQDVSVDTVCGELVPAVMKDALDSFKPQKVEVVCESKNPAVIMSAKRCNSVVYDHGIECETWLMTRWV